MWERKVLKDFCDVFGCKGNVSSTYLKDVYGPQQYHNFCFKNNYLEDIYRQQLYSLIQKKHVKSILKQIKYTLVLFS